MIKNKNKKCTIPVVSGSFNGSDVYIGTNKKTGRKIAIDKDNYSYVYRDIHKNIKWNEYNWDIVEIVNCY